eukprot:GDKI01043416.1.p1 GENE.GDKI01043416.1~~GDKI01043416.1.p1  ORF type:complete len:193 (+),score=55.38 GDKI01043416.1:239-817(+)
MWVHQLHEKTVYSNQRCTHTLTHAPTHTMPCTCKDTHNPFIPHWQLPHTAGVTRYTTHTHTRAVVHLRLHTHHTKDTPHPRQLWAMHCACITQQHFFLGHSAAAFLLGDRVTRGDRGSWCLLERHGWLRHIHDLLLLVLLQGLGGDVVREARHGVWGVVVGGELGLGAVETAVVGGETVVPRAAARSCLGAP